MIAQEHPTQSQPDLRRVGLHPDYWYPLARAKDLKPGGTLGVTFAGEPIVLVRGAKSGEVYALEDRCAHRQVPLHKGVVKGDRLQCNYHCWTYDKTGRCVSVPYLDDEKRQPTQVRAYPAQEAYGFIFVFTGDPAKAESTPMPDLPAYHDPEYRVRVLDRRIDCHYTFMHENLMDMNHQFLHRKLMGKIRATLHDVRSGDDWVEAKYTFARLGGRQSVGEKMMVGGGRPKHAGRDKDGMIIRTEYPYQRLTFTVPGADKPALDLWNIYMPVDAEQRTNQTYGLMMIRKPPKMTMKALPGRPSLIDAFWPMIVWFTESIFAEDQDIVEQEQAAFDAKGRDENNEVFPPIIALRDLLRRGGVPMDDAARTTTLLQAAE